MLKCVAWEVLCRAHDHLRAFLGLRAKILVQFCKYDVKTLHLVGAERVVVKE